MASTITVEEQKIADFLSKWWITVAVMGSLLMQLLLLLTGGTRKWSMACQLVAWNAYNWSDYIATTALGGLSQVAVGGTTKEVYAIWAPMLLLHLGAPDNISAYTTADAELWQRHGLTMLLQIVTVIYVVAKCARGWKYVLLSICLTALGSMKYAERILALKRASHADVIESTLPIYKYMLAEASLNLDIRGAVNGLNKPISSSQSLPAHTSHPTPSYYYILRGEKQWLRHFLQAGETNYIHNFSDAATATPEFVTLQDILSSQQLSRTPSIVFLCVGFALFKLYKRRLSGLYMYEWRQEKTRELFLKKHVFQNVREITFVLDAELRFLFDSLYTKAAGTAFSKLGISFRIMTTILLVVSSVFIFAGYLNLDQQAFQQARNVTISLIAAALVIEAYQLTRIALSDWSRVWLACTYIVVGEKLQKRSGWTISCYLRAFWLAALLRMIRLSGRLGRHNYWRSRIGQYAMLDADSRSTWQCSVNAKMAGLIGRNRLQLLPKYEHSTQAVDEFRSYVLTKVLTACQEIGLNQNFNHPAWFLPRYENRHQPILLAALGKGGYFDFEHLVVNWHVATYVCELLAAHPPIDHLQHGSAVAHHQHSHFFNDTSLHVNNKSDFAPVPPIQDLSAGTENITLVDLRMSKLLSRYLMYLLVHKTELLPCHAQIARELAANTERDMHTLTWNAEFIVPVLISMASNNIDHTPSMPNLPPNLMPGMQVGSLVQALSSEVRWRLLTDVWVDILLCAAATNKPIEQLQQLTLGGEFLTHLWVLLGHMGCGAQ